VPSALAASTNWTIGSTVGVTTVLVGTVAGGTVAGGTVAGAGVVVAAGVQDTRLSTTAINRPTNENIFFDISYLLII